MSNADHEERIANLEAARRELEDTFLVMTHLETKQSNIIKDLAVRQAEYEEKHLLRMAEFDDKLNALLEIIGRQQGGMEARPSG